MTRVSPQGSFTAVVPGTGSARMALAAHASDAREGAGANVAAPYRLSTAVALPYAVPGSTVAVATILAFGSWWYGTRALMRNQSQNETRGRSSWLSPLACKSHRGFGFAASLRRFWALAERPVGAAPVRTGVILALRLPLVLFPRLAGPGGEL